MSGQPDTAINTFTGQVLDFAKPDSKAIKLEDVARGLSMAPRFGGQAERFYSVAEHAVSVALTVEQLVLVPPVVVLAALHHDSHEAYACDLPRPLKRVLGDSYYAVTDDLQRAIEEALGVTAFPDDSREARLIDEADQATFFVEAETLLTGERPSPDVPPGVLAAARSGSMVHKRLSHTGAKARFLQVHRRLATKLSLAPKTIAGTSRAGLKGPGSRQGKAPPGSAAMAFPLLNTNGRLLIAVHLSPRASLAELAEQIDRDDRTVSRALNDLTDAGLLKRERDGKRNRYAVKLDARLGPLATLADLLALLEDES
ncbi:MAG: MarR family transcriptional regulator [Solirubrobacterales bacterium]